MSDICPSFFSSYDRVHSMWRFLAPDDALLRLIQWLGCYVVVAILACALFWWLRRSWFKYIPLSVAIVTAVYLISNYWPNDTACSDYQVTKEMPQPLFQYNLFMDILLLLIPLSVYFVLRRQKIKSDSWPGV